MPKAFSKKKIIPKHDPLATQMKEAEINKGGVLSVPGKRTKSKRQQVEQPTLDAKVSRKVLGMARDQQDEQALEDDAEWDDEEEDAETGRMQGDESEEEQDEEEEEESDEEEEYEYDELEIDEGDQAILDNYMPQGQLNPGETLADLILRKINEQEEGKDKPAQARREPPPGFNPKIAEVYTKVGNLLSRYKSGPLPKAFKILPTLSMWPTLVMLTNPEDWTPHATLAATRLFASNLDPKQSQKFYKEILLEKVREEIGGEGNKLSVQSYAALKKAMYKPAAFFKGILFPLCESGTCTLREAAIIGSVLTKVSVPVLHSGAALLKLADMDYTGPNSLFIRVLLDKKYALPYKVVDSLVFHFIRFKRDARVMPVLWHQSFLVFVQRYKQDLTAEQKDALLDVLRAKTHPQITPEIRREIVHSVARGEEMVQEGEGMDVEIA